MTNQSVIRLKLTIPTLTTEGNGAEGGEAKSYILTLALAAEAETEDYCPQIQLELLDPSWSGTGAQPTPNSEVMPSQGPPTH